MHHLANAFFWNGRRVLVTGHTGFKGGWLSMMLLEAGARVSGLALLPDPTLSLFALTDLQRDVDSRIGDIRDLETVRTAVRESRPEYIFHLAAQPLVRAGYANPVATYATNVLGTAHVLEAARESGSVHATIVVTSDKCYRNREWLWGYREDEPLGGDDPYSSSKAAAELVAQAYRMSFRASGALVATCRAGNVIGGGDWSPERLVPDVIAAAFARQRPTLRSPSSVRPWQHVLEPLAGYLRLAERLESDASAADAWNFGPCGERNLTVAELTEALLLALGRPAEWTVSGDEGVHEARLLHVDSTKARTLLGWRTALDDRAAVDWTVQWYHAWNQGEDMRAVTMKQIREYAER